MVDVFISYARAEIERVRPLNQALQGFGLATFFDIEGLDGSDEFPDEIDRALRAAGCVIGVWSPHALSRPWVKKEARIAVHRDVLVTARIAPLVIEDHSTEFAGRHLSDLTGFTGDLSHPGFLELVRAVADKLNRPALRQLALLAAGNAEPASGVGAAPRVADAAAKRWARIETSLNVGDYTDFLDVFPQSPRAAEARWHRSQLQEWARVNRTDADAIGAFVETGLFPALDETCRAAREMAIEAHVAREAAAKEAQAARARFSETCPQHRTPCAVWSDAIPGLPAVACPEMVTIPAGRFLMGSPPGEAGRSDSEGPQREVTIGAPFALGKYPVTFAEWDAAVAAGATLHKPGDHGWGRGRRPVIDVSWEDAQDYCAWLNAQGGHGPDGPWRLPSEAEWEYACRAGTTTRYAFGNKITKAQAQFSEGSIGSAKGTVPVGQFSANGFGLHDMHGNVWEWCRDCWNDNYSGLARDGSAITTGNCSDRVFRGGSWSYDPPGLRSAQRNGSSPSLRGDFLGFRLARTL